MALQEEGKLGKGKLITKKGYPPISTQIPEERINREASFLSITPEVEREAEGQEERNREGSRRATRAEGKHNRRVSGLSNAQTENQPKEERYPQGKYQDLRRKEVPTEK